VNYASVLAYFEEKQEEILQAIRRLVEEETPSDDKGRLDAFARLLADRYQAAGAKVEIIANQDRGDHVRALFANPTYVADPAAKPALILCHFDTVWPVGSLETHPFRVDEQGWAYGPGIFDMQSSLALVEYLLRGVQDLALTLPRPVVLLVTSDEEVGSHTSRRRLRARHGIATARRRPQNLAQGHRHLQADGERPRRPCRRRAGKRDQRYPGNGPPDFAHPRVEQC
jgi:glutamate carboxypeptidase